MNVDRVPLVFLNLALPLCHKFFVQDFCLSSGFVCSFTFCWGRKKKKILQDKHGCFWFLLMLKSCCDYYWFILSLLLGCCLCDFSLDVGASWYLGDVLDGSTSGPYKIANTTTVYVTM